MLREARLTVHHHGHGAVGGALTRNTEEVGGGPGTVGARGRGLVPGKPGSRLDGPAASWALARRVQ